MGWAVGFAPFEGVVVQQVIDFPCRTIRQNSTFRASHVRGYVHGALAFRRPTDQNTEKVSLSLD